MLDVTLVMRPVESTTMVSVVVVLPYVPAVAPDAATATVTDASAFVMLTPVPAVSRAAFQRLLVASRTSSAPAAGALVI